MRCSIVAGAFTSVLSIALCLFTLFMPRSSVSYSNLKAEAAEARPRRVEAKAPLWGPCSDKQSKQKKWMPLGPKCLQQSLMYIKVPKTGSSTVGGVMRRIANRYGLFGAGGKVTSFGKVQWEPFCAANHGRAAEKVEAFRQHTLPTNLITFVRDPLTRAISKYFHFKVGRLREKSTPEATKYFVEHEDGDGETAYIRTSNTISSDSVALLAGYRFVGVTERMDESMVALKHVLDLPSLCDVLYVSAKNSSGPPHKDDKGFLFHSHEAVERDPEILALRQSASWRERFEPDLSLHATANKKLDGLIAQIGKTLFEADLSDFRKMLEEAKVKCTGEEHPQCYWNDNGCYYDCLDRLCSSQR